MAKTQKVPAANTQAAPEAEAESRTAETATSQSGGDLNDPRRRHPSDPEFTGQGLDLSVYGTPAKTEQ